MHALRQRIFHLVEPGPGESDSLAAKAYDWLMIALIVLSLIPLAFKNPPEPLVVLEMVAVCVFVVDYAMRWVTADLKLGGNPVLAFVRYPFTAMAIVDLLSILPVFVALNQSFRLLRLTRALRAFQVFRLVRYSRSMQILVDVLRGQKGPLFAVLSLAVGYILISALIVFNVEPATFENFFEAVYWATVSLMTVGYGDIYPVSEAGRFVAMVGSLFGVAIVALPAGIVTAGYMEEMERQGEFERGRGEQPREGSEDDAGIA